MIDDEKSHLRKIARDLYVTDIRPPERKTVLHQEHFEVPHEWSDPVAESKPSMTAQTTPHTLFKKIFLGSFAFLVIALGFFIVTLFTGGNTISERNVEITVIAKSFVDGGEDLPVVVSIKNKNNASLELATLVLKYPEGDDPAGTISRTTREIESIEAGKTREETYNLKLFGTENSQKTLTASLEFRVPGSNAIYTAESEALVTIRTSPVTVTVEAPESVIPFQEFPLTLRIRGNGTAPLERTALMLDYPEGFEFKSADPAPALDNRIWDLGDLPPGADRVIVVRGTLSGMSTEAKTLRGSLGIQSEKNERQFDTIYTSLAQVIPLTNAFIDAKFAIDGATDSSAAITANQQVRVTIPWKNTLTVPITNAEFNVTLSGSAYDPARVEAGSGFFESSTNKIIWTPQQVPGLATINPGQSGTISFAVRPKSVSGITGAQNILISLSVSGYQPNGSKLTAIGIDRKTITLNSDVNLLAKTSYSVGAISNTGTVPPKVGKETTYTLQWTLVNSRNRVADAVVSTTLPLGVTWKNEIVPAAESSAITYNTITRQITWNAGDVGVGNASDTLKTVSFKVGIIPTLGQVGENPVLTGPMTLTGRDTVTNQSLTVTKLPLNTRLINEGGDSVTSGQVVP